MVNSTSPNYLSYTKLDKNYRIGNHDPIPSFHCNGKISEIISLNEGKYDLRARVSYLGFVQMTLLFTILLAMGEGLTHPVNQAALGGILLTLPLSLYWYRKYKSQEEGFIIQFERKTGLVHVEGAPGYPEFSLSFKHFDLWGGKRSHGAGTSPTYCSELGLTDVPSDISKHPRPISLPFLCKTEQEAKVYWAAVSQFMDKTQPIPAVMLPQLQYNYEEQLESGIEYLAPDVFSQAPFATKKVHSPEVQALVDKGSTFFSEYEPIEGKQVW